MRISDWSSDVCSSDLGSAVWSCRSSPKRTATVACADARAPCRWSCPAPRSPAGRSVLPRIRADQRGSRANTYGKLYPCSPALIRGRKGRAGSAADRGLAYNRRMKEKEQIVENWLPRYTGVPLDQFGEHILQIGR